MSSRDNCIFCNIAQGKDEKSTVLYDDCGLVVFRDIRPAAQHHYLVCPKEHIRDAKSLNYTHLPLVDSMVEAGKQVLREQGGDATQTRLGFHWPPFHMVSHLHLHVISPPEGMGFLARVIFRQNSWWFVTETWLRDRLLGMKPKDEPEGRSGADAASLPD